MNVKIKRFIRFFVFCVVFFIVFGGINTLLKPTYIQGRWDTSSSMVSFYEEEEDTIEVVAIGSSVCVAGIDPYQMYKEHGISAFNMAVISEPMIGNYYWLKECYKTQKPKVVLLEIQIAARKREKKEEKFRKCYDYMKFGWNKLAFAYAYCRTDEDADFMEYVFPLMKFHDRWNQVTAEDWEFAIGEYQSVTKGFNALVKSCGIVFEGTDMAKDKLPKKYSETDYDYLEKIIDLCRENGSKIVLFKTPDSTWTVQKHNLIQKRAEEKNVPFLDFSETGLFAELGIHYETEANDEQHLNLYGAKKLTSYLGRYLTENYELTDIRETEMAKSFEEGFACYEEYMKEAERLYQENSKEQ